MRLCFVPTESGDFEALLALRIEAMRRVSLECLGRFDAQRARERYLANFEPACTQHIEAEQPWGHDRLEFFAVKAVDGLLLLDQLYLRPGAHWLGVGAAVLAHVFERADAQRLELRVGALRGNDANGFYQRHGLVLVDETALDNYYRRVPRNRPSAPPSPPAA